MTEELSSLEDLLEEADEPGSIDDAEQLRSRLLQQRVAEVGEEACLPCWWTRRRGGGHGSMHALTDDSGWLHDRPMLAQRCLLACLLAQRVSAQLARAQQAGTTTGYTEAQLTEIRQQLERMFMPEVGEEGGTRWMDGWTD